MGKRGPPPKPNALKELEGTARADRSVRREMVAPPGTPRCPKFLDAVGRGEWRRVVPVLEELGVLSKIDGATLEGYCASYSRAVAAEAEIQRLGLVVDAKQGPVPNPAASIARNEWAAVRKFAAEFGLTPAARTRISVPGGESEDAQVERDLYGRPGLRALDGGGDG